MDSVRNRRQLRTRSIVRSLITDARFGSRVHSWLCPGGLSGLSGIGLNAPRLGIRGVRRPVSRVLSTPFGRWMAIPLGRPLPSASRDRPGRRRGNPLCRLPGVPPLFGLAPGGVCRAACVTARAVGSYPTVSPLPAVFVQKDEADRRSVLCGTFPGVAPAGR